MSKIYIYSIALTSLLATGCGSGDSKKIDDPIDTTTPDILMSTMVSDTLAYLTTFNGSKEANLTVRNAMEIAPTTRPYVYRDKIYATQPMTSNIFLKIDDNNGTLVKEAEMALSPQNLLPSSPIFINETKAYLPLMMTGELAVFNPTTMEIIKKIDLSSYAVGEGDTNPEPVNGIVRDGKLYLALWQISDFQTFTCRGIASMIIIDIATDTIEKQIEDDRTCLITVELADNTMMLDENNDIYIFNRATFRGANEGTEAGFLRIKDGQSDFDPDYFFSISQLENLPVEGGKANYLFQGIYGGSGKYYTVLNIPALASNPPDYVNDRTMQPFVLDIYNQSATKIDLPTTNSWSAAVLKYKEKYLYGLAATTGIGLYRYDPITNEADQKPFINTEGMPMVLKNLN